MLCQFLKAVQLVVYKKGETPLAKDFSKGVHDVSEEFQACEDFKQFVQSGAIVDGEDVVVVKAAESVQARHKRLLDKLMAQAKAKAEAKEADSVKIMKGLEAAQAAEAPAVEVAPEAPAEVEEAAAEAPAEAHHEKHEKHEKKPHSKKHGK